MRVPAKPMIPTKPTETDKNRQTSSLLTSKSDEICKNRQKTTLVTSFSSVFFNTGTASIFISLFLLWSNAYHGSQDKKLE